MCSRIATEAAVASEVFRSAKPTLTAYYRGVSLSRLLQNHPSSRWHVAMEWPRGVDLTPPRELPTVRNHLSDRALEPPLISSQQLISFSHGLEIRLRGLTRQSAERDADALRSAPVRTVALPVLRTLPHGIRRVSSSKRPIRALGPRWAEQSGQERRVPSTATTGGRPARSGPVQC